MSEKRSDAAAPDELLIERTYEPDDDAVARAVAILLRKEPQTGEGEAA